MLNLAFDSWIPCVGYDGTMLQASLSRCFMDRSIADFVVRPHERVALMRLALCVAHAALGVPKNYAAWLACREHLPDAAVCYLKKWQDSFELFHPKKPFLQIAGLRSAAKNEEPTPTSKLDFALAAGNNSTFFDHEALNPHRAFSPETLALNLLTYQAFSLGGTTGCVAWNGQAMNNKSSDAPCCHGSLLHAFLRGKNLPETIWLNLLSADELHGYDGNFGRPIWEKFPKGPHDETAVHNATRTYIGRLVPLSRAILLQENGAFMLLGNGLTYPVFPDFLPEPSAVIVVRKGKKDAADRVALSIYPDKSLWRELHALVVQRQTDGPGGCLALAHADDAGDAGSVDLVAGGLTRNQAKVVDAVESVFHVPVPLFRTEGQDFYANEVQKAEELEYRALAFAMEHWRVALDGGWETRLKLAGNKRGEICIRLRAQAARDYWTSVEHNLSLLLAALNALGTEDFLNRRQAWRNMLRESVLNAYTMACMGDGKRQLWAFVTGKKILLTRTNKILELHKGGKE